MTDKTDSNLKNAILSNTQPPANQKTDNEVPQILNNIEQPLKTVADSTLVVVEMSPNTEELTNATTQKNDDTKGNESKKPKRHEKPKEEVTFRTHITSLAQVSIVVFVYMVLKLAFRGDFVFFTWHPILMAVGWMFLMTEGFYVINKYNTYWRKKTKGGFRVKIHVIILSVGYILALTAFAIAYVNKDNLGKNHFTTWHALFGLIGLISTFPPVVIGFLLWYKKELANYIDRPRLVKFIHVSSGTLAFFFGALALILSVYSNWYAKKSYRSDSTFYLGLVTVSFPLLWAVYGPSVKLARVIKDYFSADKVD